jgi:ketosteroid isomerase-like protein
MTTISDRASARATARSPEQVCDLFAAYATAGDVEGLVSLYEPDAQLVLPSGRAARGPEQLRAACAELCACGAAYAVRTVASRQSGDLALLMRTCTITAQGSSTAGTCSPMVARRQPDGRWLAVIDDSSGGTS